MVEAHITCFYYRSSSMHRFVSASSTKPMHHYHWARSQVLRRQALWTTGKYAFDCRTICFRLTNFTSTSDPTNSVDTSDPMQTLLAPNVAQAARNISVKLERKCEQEYRLAINGPGSVASIKVAWTDLLQSLHLVRLAAFHDVTKIR